MTNQDKLRAKLKKKLFVDSEPEDNLPPPPARPPVRKQRWKCPRCNTVYDIVGEMEKDDICNDCVINNIPRNRRNRRRV